MYSLHRATLLLGVIIPLLPALCSAVSDDHPSLAKRTKPGCYAIITPNPDRGGDGAISQFEKNQNYYISIKFGDGWDQRSTAYDTDVPEFWFKPINLNTANTAGKEIQLKTLAVLESDTTVNTVGQWTTLSGNAKEWYYIYLGKDRAQAQQKAKNIVATIRDEFNKMDAGKANDVDKDMATSTTNFATVFNAKVKAEAVKQ